MVMQNLTGGRLPPNDRHKAVSQSAPTKKTASMFLGVFVPHGNACCRGSFMEVLYMIVWQRMSLYRTVQCAAFRITLEALPYVLDLED